jgi:transposase
LLARIARADEKQLYPIEHGIEDTQLDLLQIKLRDNLVRQRVAIISSVRFTLKSLGIKLRSPNTASFARYARKELETEHANIIPLVEPSLIVLDSVTTQIRELEKAIETIACEKYPETEFLTQIAGVGILTSLTFVLTVGDPARFRRRRDVAAYFGLVPKRDQSGDTDKQLRISKAGDSYMRRLLVNAAQYILGPFGPDCDLKRQGLKLAERGGSGAKKKAVIAIARKLSVLMLVLWYDEELYEPNLGLVLFHLAHSLDYNLQPCCGVAPLVAGATPMTSGRNRRMNEGDQTEMTQLRCAALLWRIALLFFAALLVWQLVVFATGSYMTSCENEAARHFVGDVSYDSLKTLLV